MDAFLEEQSTQRAHAAKAFEQIIDKLQALVEKVCKDVTTRAKLSDETIGVQQSVDEPEGATHEASGKHRSKSMAKLKQEQHARLMAVRRAATEAQMLGDFIRLADYMTVSCCYLLTVGTAEKLSEILQAPRAKSGLWVTKVEFGQTEMSFVPAQSHFHQSVQALLEGMITSIHAVPRLLYMRPFKPYFHSGRVEGPDVAKLVREAAKFKQVQAELDQIVVEASRARLERHVGLRRGANCGRR